jgi:hypothetical protein
VEAQNEKGTIEWRRWQRQYRFQYRAPTPPPQNPRTCDEKLAVAAYRAAKLMNSEGWSAWRKNGGARQFKKAVEETIAPKKVWLKKYIRDGRRQRRDLRVAVLKRNAAAAAAAAAAGQWPIRALDTEANSGGHSNHARLDEQPQPGEPTPATVAAAVAAAAVAVANQRLEKTPAAATEFGEDTAGAYNTTTQVEVEEPPPMKRKCPVMIRIRKRIRDSFNPARRLFPPTGEEKEVSKIGADTPAPTPVSSTTPTSSLEDRVEAMRPTLEAIDYEKTYNERTGKKIGPKTPPRLSQEATTSTPDLIRLSPIIKPMPLMENSLWRRRMKAMEDKKMSISINEDRSKALSRVWEAEAQLEMASQYLLHLSLLKRRMEVLKALKMVEAIKSGLEDDTLADSEDEEEKSNAK